MEDFYLNLVDHFQAFCPYIVGFLITVFAGHYIIDHLVNSMWQIIRQDVFNYLIEKEKTKEEADVLIEKSRILKRYASQPASVGLIERFLYLGSLQIKRPEFIGVWLGIKTIVESNRWKGDSQKKVNEGDSEFTAARNIIRPLIPGRAIYNTFLFGNALSLLFAFIGSWIIDLIIKSEFEFAIGLLILSSITLVFGQKLILKDIRRYTIGKKQLSE